MSVRTITISSLQKCSKERNVQRREKESTTQLSVELFIAVNLMQHDGLKGNSPLGIHILNDTSSGGTLLIVKIKPC